jgi:hypothetical protein
LSILFPNISLLFSRQRQVQFYPKMLLMGQNAMAKRKVTKVLRKGDNSISTSDILPEHLRSTPSFNGVRVTRPLVLCVCLVNRCLSFCPLSFGHCAVCPSSIYGYWLPFWYLQTLLRCPFVSHDRVQEGGIVITTNVAYLWSSVTQTFLKV